MKEVHSSWISSFLQRIHSKLPLFVQPEMILYSHSSRSSFFQVRFITRIYHPNVNSTTGEICARVINDNWGPTLNTLYVLNVIRTVRNRILFS